MTPLAPRLGRPDPPPKVPVLPRCDLCDRDIHPGEEHGVIGYDPVVGEPSIICRVISDRPTMIDPLGRAKV